MRLYHGTRTETEVFEEYLVGSGYEPNSALGVWLTSSPHIAADYAGEGGRVMIVDVDAPSLLCCRDYHSAIWGGRDLMPTDREISMPIFEEARTDLMGEGFDGVWIECPGTDLEGAVCIFDPSRIRVISCLVAPDAETLDRLPEMADDSRIDFGSSLEDRLSSLAPALDDLCRP